MEKYKNLIVIMLIVCYSQLYAQSKDSLNLKYKLSKNLKLDFLYNDFTLNFKRIDFSKNNISFSEYNPTTGLNDNYSLINDEHVYTNSSFLFQNNIRGPKIDSFNPYGASNIQTSLVLGTFNKLLDKIQK